MSSTQIYISPQPINTNQDQTQNSSYKPDNNIIKIQENTIYNDNLTEPWLSNTKNYTIRTKCTK